MRTSKLLAFLAVISVVLITGCNKNESWLNGPDSGNSALMPLKSAMVTTVPLGSAVTFAVLGGTTVTNAGISLITGDAGVGTAGTELTGFFPTPINTIVGPGTVTAGGEGTVTGTIYAGGDIAAQAHADAQIAYDYLVAQIPTTQYLDVVNELGGLTLTPGIYNYPSSVELSAGQTLTLNFLGDPNALFIFQVGSTLVTKLNTEVIATNTGGATTCIGPNVFWAVGSSATIDGSSFIGTVIAYTSISMTSAANTIVETNVSGRMLALGGAVTMSTDNISTCGTSVGIPKHPKFCRDFVTGGGWINDKETFGVSGGIMNGKFWGQLSFNDHDGVKVKSTEVTGYIYINATTREIKGHAKVNGRRSVDYTVVVSDNGEPGRHDTFSLVLSNGFDFSTSGTLEGGNIQLHKECGDSHNKNDKWDRRDKHDNDNNCDKEDYNDKDENDGHKNCDNDHWRKH